MAKNMTVEQLKEVQAKLGLPISPYWTNLLRGLEVHEVGVIKASGKLIVPPSLDLIVSDYEVLDNQLGIALPLVIGGGPQYDALPAYSSSGKVNGIRVTSSELLSQILPVAQQNLDSVVNALDSSKVSAVAMPYSVFRVKPHGVEVDSASGKEQDVGFVGDVVYVDTAPVIAALYQGKIPVLSHIGVDDNGQQYNINATTAAAELVKWLQAYKLIVLGNCPILDNTGQVISEFKSEAALNQMIKQGVINGGMALNAREAYAFLKAMGPGRTVQLTTPANLLKELVSDGAGTILRMPFIIQSYQSPEHFGTARLTDLINDAFASRGKRLSPGYFLDNGIIKLYVDAEKTGGAIVKQLEGVPYMCKLFTHPDFRGNGLASQIMERINADYG
ncbi:MAG: hypothetical protein KJ922_05215, partial [Nanoarchaeota archaeon]|nr:hypothetical protein [Nanoarchaeota archaeon]